MSKRSNRVLYATIFGLFGLLLSLNWLVPISGNRLAGPALLRPEARFPQVSRESEPNDTIDTADPLGVDRTILGRIPLTQTRDVDWYRLTLSNTDIGRGLRANLEETYPDEDYILELNLYDAQANLIQSAASDSITSVDWTPAMITYYVRSRAVFFQAGAGRDADYRLTTLHPPTPTPAPYQPTLYISYREGAPGSVFTLTGLGFPESDEVSIWLNGYPLGAVSGSSGWFRFLLDTANAQEGLYIVVTSAEPVAPMEFFVLDANEPLREPTDSGPIFSVPSGIAFTNQVFLPIFIQSE